MGWCGEWCIAKRQAEGREEAVGGGWRMWGGGRLEEGSCCRREQAALECFFRQTEKSKHISDSAEIFNSIVRGSQDLPWRSALLRGRHLQTFCSLCRAASSSSSWLMLLFFTSSQLLWPPPSASLSYISSCSLKMKCYFIPVLYYLPFWLLSSDGVEIRGNEALVATSVERKKKKEKGKKCIIGSRTNLETESGRFQCAFKFGDSCFYTVVKEELYLWLAMVKPAFSMWSQILPNPVDRLLLNLNQSQGKLSSLVFQPCP